MDTFRKWLNKPKADDKSLLARFYHADRSLTAVTSELDSFDGRAEPDRCSRLVSRLRQGQDKVLAITNLIMEELLGEDRDQRAFRAKFPEEVLQENLAGQLWFGAECLAAGSSILNREQESKEMRPLAQAVTKSLGNVRNLLRDQCLRNNVPNSKTLLLNLNDSSTEQLYECLKIFDRLFAEFELRYVSAMVPVKTKQEFEMQELISVLFSETLQRALKIGLLEQDKVDAFDPALMFSIPRLAIIAGLVIYPDGPLNMNLNTDELSEMFRPFRTILIKIRDLLNALETNYLFELEKLLCTNEDINTRVPIGTSSIEAPCTASENESNKNKNSIKNCDDNVGKANNENSVLKSNAASNNLAAEQVSRNSNLFDRNNYHQPQTCYIAKTDSPSVSVNSSIPSILLLSSPAQSITPSNSLASTTSSAATDSTAAEFYDAGEDITEFDVDDNDNEAFENSTHLNSNENDIVAADCASGYLIPNTNFGSLLQPQEVPLNGNFTSNEDGFSNEELQSSFSNEDVPTTSSGLLQTQQTEIENCFDSPSTSSQNCCHHHHSRYICHHRSSNHNHVHSKLKRCYRSSTSSEESAKTESNRNNIEHVEKATSSTIEETSGSQKRTLSSFSNVETRDKPLLASNASGRLRFKNTENLLHRLFVCIAGVADQLQTNFASDLRQILRSVFLMNMTITQEEKIDLPEKTKETELFEFRASENDVIQDSNNGSNQSIYSAEEVNPDLDSVFNNNNSNSSRSSVNNNNTLHSTGSFTTIHDVNSIDLGTIEPVTHSSHNHMERCRSLGDHEDQQNNNINNNDHNHNRRLSAFVSEQRKSTIPQNRNDITTAFCQQRHRNNSVGSNSPSSSRGSSSSESNSPICERANSNVRTENSNNVSVSSSVASDISIHSAATLTGAPVSLAPPAWIPDDKAPRCMSCQIQFTAFRRRHHCRNCGGVFCSVCSNASAPLPKFGLIKAVRVCRNCYMQEVCSSQISHQGVNTATVGGS